MGKLFQRTHEWVKVVDPNSIFLEIGSDRYEGSTEYFANLATTHHVEFHTVDIDTRASNRLRHLNARFHVMDGQKWIKSVLPTLNKTVSLLYLDNFDYIWDAKNLPPYILEQKEFYRNQVGIEMNNENCQIIHMQQMISCLPYMDERALIICDDTYTDNDCWVGKCGPVVVWLMAQGWLKVFDGEGGVILASPKYFSLT